MADYKEKFGKWQRDAKEKFDEIDDQLGREYEDLVAATCLLGDGTIANHLVNWLSPLKERVTVITGERGAFVADTLTAGAARCGCRRAAPSTSR